MVDSLQVGVLHLALYVFICVLFWTGITSYTNIDNTVDVLISFAWFAAFGILVDAIHHLPCGSIWNWHFGSQPLCARWKAAEAFSFLSAIMWLFSALVVSLLEKILAQILYGS